MAATIASSAVAYVLIWALFLIVKEARVVVFVQFRLLPAAFRHLWRGAAVGGVLVAANAGVLMALGAFQPIPDWRPHVSAVGLALVWTATVATTEEMMLRGLLLTRLRPLVGDAVAMLTTAALFAVMHVGRADFSALSVAQYFVDGMLLAWIVVSTGSIWAAVGLHFAKNFGVALLFGGSHRLVEPWLARSAAGSFWQADLAAYSLATLVCLMLFSRMTAMRKLFAGEAIASLLERPRSHKSQP